MPQPTAILLFSRTAAAEAVAKDFGRESQRIARALIERTQRTLRRSGLPVYAPREGDQFGDTFGERLAAAAARVFSRGHRHLLIVGNDCPTLRLHDLREAAAVLAAGGTVVGADGRGGAYLIGLQASDYQPEAFAELPWCSPRLFARLSLHLGSASHLRPRKDINRLADLRAQWHEIKRLLWRIADLVCGYLRRYAPQRRPIASCFTEVYETRGPPRGTA